MTAEAKPEGGAAADAAPDKGADAAEPEEGVANGLDVDTATAPAAAATEEVKTDAAAAPTDKAATDAKKPAAGAAPATVGYTPILDSEVSMVGICNKAHKRSVNLIQVLYCKSVGNAMM